MNSRERYEFHLKNGFIKEGDDLEIIKTLVNRLIDNLYKPVKYDLCFVADKAKVERHKLYGEPFNWGALSCSEVIKESGYYKVIIDEASPDGCEMLCEYIESYMKSWGWNVKCETEW